MHASIEAYLAAEQALLDAQEEVERCRELAREVPLPEKLRPASAADIVEGAILWYPRHSSPAWKFVEDVDCPSDPWKAYTADDGCRYGLEGAFVEEE